MTTITTTLDLTLDTVPPSLNNLYRTVTIKGVSRRVLSGPAKAWKAGAALVIRNAARRQGFDLAPRQPFAMQVAYQAPNILMWDLDGKPKLLIDSLCEALGVDDRYLMDLRQTKQRGPTGIALRVMVVK